MRKITAVVCAVLAIQVLTHQPAHAAGKAASGDMVIVFKDGHRQSIHLSEVDRIEFPGGATTGSGAPSAEVPPRGRFFGKWEVGDGVGNTFTITLNENGTASRSLGDVHGKWEYVNGEARITWTDGAKDVIRRVGTQYQKAAYGAGKSFEAKPDNIADAHNTSPRPI